MNRRLPLAPAEGWLSLGCVLLICLTMAWSLDDARWVLARPNYLDYLVIAAVGGVLSAFIGVKVGWGRWLTYLIGSIFAALLIPLLTALVANPVNASPHDLFQATSDSVYAAYNDIAILNLSSTSQYLHFVFVFGILVWATSMFASYAVFGHHRPLNGVVAVGIILVANMWATPNDQLALLVLFSLASLFLLIRSHVFDEQSEWLRRRIGDPGSISSVYLRGGTAFIVVAVIASFVLTETAASAPLAGAWGGVKDGLLSVSRSVSRFLPTGGQTRAVGLSFGPDAQVGQQWNNSGALAVTIQRDPNDDGDYYWRAATYDRIDFKGWGQSTPAQTLIPAGAEVLEGRADDVDPLGRHTFTFTVTPGEFSDSTVLSPETPTHVGEEVRMTTVGKDGYFATLDRTNNTGAYTVTALTPVRGNEPGQINQAALRVTDTTYPQEIQDLYLGVAKDSLGNSAVGPNAKKLEEKILVAAKSTAPIDIVDAIWAELRSSVYTYDTDIRDLDCSGFSTVECFATFKQGFCQYYAATMAVILRDVGIPTRIAQGFLPGSREKVAGLERLSFSGAHAWVEVYFPGYGWVLFDPTGGSLPGQIGPLPSGPPNASLPPRPSAATSGGVLPPFPGRDPLDEGPDPGGFTPQRSIGPLAGVLALLVVIVGVLAFVAWQRGPRGPTSADGAYGTVVRIASRFGFGPRPAQTVYEYAGSLGEVLPGVRPELETVAQAKVESVYARQVLGQERLDRIRAAQRRLRVSLLRLAFLRKERRRR